MAFVGVTRLRLRAWRFLPPFAVDTWRSLGQTRRAEGFVAGSVLADGARTFWTLTLWRERADMKRFMASGPHARAMPKLLGWCDEGSVAHWTQEGDALPSWPEADRRMRAEGRPSKVRHPSADHAALTFVAPRPAGAVPIRPIR